MAAHGGPNLSDPGLQLYIDPINPKSYPGSGTTVYDLSGNGRHGTLTNSTAASAGYFGFTNSSMSITFSSFNIADNKTLSFWIKTDRPLSVTDNWEIGFLNSSFNYGTMFGMMYGVGECQDLGYWGYGGPYDMSVEAVDNAWSSDGNWHNCVITYDSSRVVRVWIDGVQKRWLLHSNYSTLSYTVTMLATTNIFYIHSRGSWDGGHTYVHLSEVAVWNRDLSDAEIVQNFNATKTRFGL